MQVSITKSARQFGYVIWNSKNEGEIQKILGKRDKISVTFNGFQIGVKQIDWKYHRISLGYKFTRALPPDAKYYALSVTGDCLEVTTKP